VKIVIFTIINNSKVNQWINAVRSIVDTTRTSELRFLEQIFDKQGPDIINVYGIPGVGKTALVNQLVKRYPERCLKMNCQQIEPTPKAFLHNLGKLINTDGKQQSTDNHITKDTVLILDQFESLYSVDSWFRREFIPSVSDRLKVIFAGRSYPSKQWIINPPDNSEFRCLKVNSLNFSDAVNYLQSLGHSKVVAMVINQFANGHPLAIQLASSAILERCNNNEVSPNNVVQTLRQYFVEDIKDPLLRQALDATSIVRRTHESLLSVMLDMGTGSVDGWVSKRLAHERNQSPTRLDAPTWFDKSARQLKVNRNRVDLTPLEYGTLDLLIAQKGSAVTRKELLRKVWGIEYEGASNVVDTIIRSLRKKLDDKADIIQSVRGIGYRYLSDSE